MDANRTLLASLLTHQLSTIATLDAADRRAIETLPVRFRTIPERRDIFREGDKAVEACVVLSGWVCRYKIISGGRRQILSLHLPGDIPDLQGLTLEVMDHSLLALEETRCAFIPHEAMRGAADLSTGLGRALARRALIDASLFREWIVNVGRRPAYERTAHLFCEIYTRLRALGLTNGPSFPTPLTQIDVADATGLSPVHVNRILQQLRRGRLLSIKAKTAVIGDWEELQRVADFNPLYLHHLASDLAPAHGAA